MTAARGSRLAQGISVVVPCYNSAATLPMLLERLEPVLRSLSADFEVILVNDASRDSTWQSIADLAKRYDFLVGLNMMRNFGQHSALLAGIRCAHHAICVTIDDDLQNPPEEIPKIVAALEGSFDVAYGSPMRQQHGVMRDFASSVTKLALRSAMGPQAINGMSAFRAFRTDLRDAFAGYQGSFVSIDVLLTWGTSRFTAVPVRHDPRATGASNYTFANLLRHALNMITGFTTLPLQLATLVGLASAGFGLLVLVYVVGRFLIEGHSVPGFPFLASIMAIFSGAMLFSIGILGEYLGRIFDRSLARPTYIVREQIDARAQRPSNHPLDAQP